MYMYNIELMALVKSLIFLLFHLSFDILWCPIRDL